MNSEEQIKDNLKGIPNCFVIRECLIGRAKKSIQHVIDRLLREMDNEIYELDNEWIRTYNFISFLYWIIGEKDKAIANNQKVHEMDENNVFAVANKMYFTLELEDAYELHISNAKIETLKKRDDFQIHLIKADAELAYCYTRLGLSLQETARLKFQKVVDDVLELKLEHVIDQNLIALWKYGLGLITRRVSKLHCSRSADQVSCCRVRRKEAIEAFLDVIHMEWDSKRLKAMAYAQLGGIAFAVFKDEQQLRDYYPEPYCNWHEERFYRMALTMYDKETYILERYGQFLRYKKRYDESETVLRKSLNIRPTSHAHHHLALTLKSKFHKQLAAQKKHFNRQISSPNIRSTPHPSFRRLQSGQPYGNHNTHVRNLFGSNSENHMAAGPQSFFNAPYNMQYYDNPNVGQCGQGNYYYENSHGGLYGPEYNYNDNRSYKYDSGYYSIPQNIQFSTDRRPQYNSLGLSRRKTKGWNNCRSSRSNGRGRCSGNKRGDSASQRSIPSSSCQSSSTSDNVHQRSATTDPGSSCNKSQDHSLLLEHSQQLDSGIESLTTAVQQIAIQDSAESHGPVKLKLPIQGGTNVTHNIMPDAFSRTSSKHRQATENEKTSSTLNLNKTQAMIKSPRKLLDLPEADGRTDEIMYHLEQAMDYSENRAALYDKGLTLRAMSHLDEAVSVFKQLIGDETSLIYLANAYEQCGLCHYEKIQKSGVFGDELKKLTYNMKDYFMKSVAISAKLLAAIPNISEIWASASSLKEVLMSDGKSKENVRQLAILHERLNNYREAITYYEDLISIEDDSKEIPKHFASVAKNQMKDSNFIAALTVLDMARTHPEGHTCIDRNMYLKCLVEGGFQAIHTGHDKQLGCKYLNTALCIASESTGTSSSVLIDENCDMEEEEGKFCLFLLCCEENEHLFNIAASVWGQMREVCGLNVTMNSLDVLWGTPKLSGRLDLVDKCKYFVVVMSSQTTEEKLYQMTLEHIILNKTNIIILLEHSDAPGPLPAVVRRFQDKIPKLVIPDTVFDETNSSNCISWLKQLLLCLLRLE